MTHNKGKKYITCPACKRKRYCAGERVPGFYYNWVCSKGHKWTIQLGQAAQIAMLELERITPKIKELFERDDIFIRHLKNR